MHDEQPLLASLGLRPKSDPWEPARKAIFKRVRVQTPSGTKTMPRLEAYLHHLTLSAKQGSRAARLETTRLMKHLDRNKILNEPDQTIIRPAFLQKKFDEKDAYCRIAIKQRSIVYFRIFEEIEKRYIEKYGKAKEDVNIVVDMIDYDIVNDLYRTLLKRRRNKTGGGIDVGYGRPPLDTRWTAGQSGNPSGGRKPRGDDAWETFRAGLSKTTTVVQNGRSTKMANAEIIVARLFEDAIKGDTKAQAELRNLLLHLEKRKLLQPPEVKRRVSRKPKEAMSPAMLIAVQFVQFKIAAEVRQDIAKCLDKVYGPLDDVETQFEINMREKLGSDDQAIIENLKAA